MKKRILNRIVDLFKVTVDDCLLEYVQKKGWTGEGQFPIKPMKLMVTSMKEVGAEELIKTTFEFVLQQALSTLLRLLEKKAVHSFAHFFADIERLGSLLGDDFDVCVHFEPRWNTSLRHQPKLDKCQSLASTKHIPSLDSVVMVPCRIGVNGSEFLPICKPFETEKASPPIKAASRGVPKKTLTSTRSFASSRRKAGPQRPAN